ncbi:hypothetical protein I6E52_09830 [Salinibacterium sp. NG253]|uniref:hypothetical protein n=1 Tax=Salinibacterium sp. NG253 TaxID=2792039 RepID=UPI0018CF7D55|nr:hypothetical protein [Salinibacterium sp. NG253]MBH0117143.1 hypothetical protein [Salinibacterium sp. NG253]
MTDIEVAGWGVIAAFAIGLGGMALTIIANLRSERRAELSRRIERRTDAYVDLLRMCHIRARGIQATVNNIVNHENIEHGFGSRQKVINLDARRDAEMAALRDAFASPSITAAHETWTESVSKYQEELDMLYFDGSSDQDSGALVALAGAQAAALDALGKCIRKELRFS